MKSSAATQAALAADLLAAAGVPARETFEVQPPDEAFVHQRVVGFDAAQFGDRAPDEALSACAVRHRDAGTPGPDALRRFIAPDVPADRGRFVEYALYGCNDGLLPLDGRAGDLPPIGVDFPTLRSPPHQLVTQRIASRGLTLEVDEDAGCLGPGWQEAKVAFLRGAIDRARLRRTVALFVAGAVIVGKTWDFTADPDMDVMDELDAQPLRASRILYGPRAWSQRAGAFRARRTDGGLASAALSPEDLGGELAVEEVRVAGAIAAAGTEPAGNGGGGQVLLFCAASQLSRNDFSHLKTFTAPARTGGRYAAFVQREGGKRWRIGVECHETVAITSTAGLGLIAVG